MTLEKFGQLDLTPGSVRDGEVVDTDLVARTLGQLWRTAKFSTKKVIVGVANPKVIVRQVDLPWLPLDELRKSLPLHVQDFLPIPVEQAILDVHPVEEHVVANGARLQRVLLVAASREMVTNAVTAVTKAGLKPIQVDLSAFALLRSLGRSDESPFGTGDAEALVDVGARVTNIVVHQNGVPRFVRILLMGGDDVTGALAERLGVPIEQAAALKHEIGIPAPTAFGAVEHPGARAIESTASSWIDEVRGSLDYYLGQPGAAGVRRVVISGGGSLLSGLAQRLQAAVRLPVANGSAVESLGVGRIGLDPQQAAGVGPLLPVPIGLAMGAAA